MSFRAPGHKLATRDFSGGYQDSPEADTLPPSSTPDAKNCLLISVQNEVQLLQSTRRAVVRKRTGHRLVNPTAIASEKSIDGLYQFLRENAAGELLAVCNGALSKFDNVDTFNAISGGGGFTAARAARFLSFHSNAFVCDGTQNLRYNGTACLAVGFIAPTAAPALAATGTGLTGTYEGFAVWYDSTMDHESSPSAVSSAVALVNQSRQWTKPSGSPPSNVDKWRIYCRRTDTNEQNYFRCAEVAVGTGSVTEAVIDQARTEIGPSPSDNDVPPAFALMEEFKGFRLGVKSNSSDLYVSKQYDAESQHPKNVFSVGGKGDSKPLQCVRKFGEECLLQKPRTTYRMVGDTLPFQFVPIESSLGNVSQEAGLELHGSYYGWDEIVGPYKTNLSQWTPLGTTRIATMIASLNRTALANIRCVHVAAYNLVMWAVPTGSSTHCHTLLAYHYILDRWLPPITGFEYASLESFTTTDGALGTYIGDQWGRVYQLFSGEIDGAPGGTTAAAITGATSSTITAGAATFYTTGSGLAGMPAVVKSPAGVWQWVRIRSNTATVLTLDVVNGPSLGPVPASDGTWSLYVGAIQWYWKTPQTDHGNPEVKKIGRWCFVQGRTTSSNTPIRVEISLNRSVGYIDQWDVTLPATGLVWGVGHWGVDVWGNAQAEATRKHRVPFSYYNAQLKFYNYYPNQPAVLTAFGLGADFIKSGTVPSV